MALVRYHDRVAWDTIAIVVSNGESVRGFSTSRQAVDRCEESIIESGVGLFCASSIENPGKIERVLVKPVRIYYTR